MYLQKDKIIEIMKSGLRNSQILIRYSVYFFFPDKHFLFCTQQLSSLTLSSFLESPYMNVIPQEINRGHI